MIDKQKKIRRAQTIQPFGVGAIIDIDGESFVVNDISEWKRPTQYVVLDRLNKIFGYQKKLLSFSSFENKEESLTVSRFPAWYHCSKCHNLQQILPSNLLLKESGKPLCGNCNNKAKLSPMRFIAYCNNGHLQEFDWWRFAHSEQQQAQTGNCGIYNKIFFKTTGRHGGDFDQMIVSCGACKAPGVPLKKLQQKVSGNFVHAKTGQSCCGTQPWLVNAYTSQEDRNKIADECKEDMRFEPRGSSSIHRSKILSALDISIKKEEDSNFDSKSLDDLLDDLILDNGGIDLTILQLESDDCRYEAKIDKRASDANISYEEALSYSIKRLNKLLSNGPTESEETEEIVKNPQENLLKDELDFFRRRMDIHQDNFDITFESTKKASKLTSLLFSHIAKIRRLREIRVFTGFSRGKGLKDIPVDVGEKRDWLPTIEAFGEGIYFELNKDTLVNYFKENGEEFAKLIKGQQQELEKLKDNFFLDIQDSDLFILTHTLSHLLIRQLTFNSGYSSSALRERIFVDPGIDYAGIMIYTSELDAEGTMGGLVDQARFEAIDLVLEKITESAIWCSADPVCRETQSQGFSGLNRSACHCCSLIAETSCTFQNAMLNRLTLGGLGKERDEVSGIFNYIQDLIQ